MQLFIIFQIVLKLFIYNKSLIYNFKYLFNNNICITTYNTLNTYYTCQNKQITNINYHNPDFIHIYCNNVHIPLMQYKNRSHLIYNNSNNNKLGIHIENNSINMVRIFSKKYSEYLMNKQTLYFYQWGIRRLLLPDQTVTLGIGKRYMHNKRYGIGYNTIFNLPILNHDRYFPYSINMGGECWYRNLVLALNGYYNLNQILCFDKLSKHSILEHPMTGYQVCIQSILPYLFECRSQIKLEKFFYAKKPNSMNNLNSSYSLSIGMGYRPIPMLEINVDNIFINKKYINTLFKIMLNYQFNVPIAHQIKQRYCNDNLLRSENVNSMLRPFLPEITDIKINDDLCNISKTTYRITGRAEEIKYIKINHNHETVLKWNTESLEENGGKITHLEDNLYKIHLPKHIRSENNQIVFSYAEQDEKNTIQNEQKILIVIEKFPDSRIVSTENNDSIITIENVQESNNLNNSNLVEYNNFVQKKSDIINSNNEQNNLLSTDHVSVHDEPQEILESSNKNDNDVSVFIPIPPSEPKSFLFSQHTITDPSSSHSHCSILEQENDHRQKADDILLSELPKKEVVHLKKSSDSSILDKNSNTKNLVEQLLIKRQTVFSSVGTTEYIEKLEKSILERKKINSTNDISRMFNKLHDSLSCSSIEDLWDMDDNTDSFSDSSFKN